MSKQIQEKILTHLKSDTYRPQKRRHLAKQLQMADDERYELFKEALRQLMAEGRVMYGAGGTIVLPASHGPRDTFVGTYRQNKRGFGFVAPTDPDAHEDLYIAEPDNGGAITGDVVRAQITHKSWRDGKPMHSGIVIEIIKRTNKRFVGSLAKLHGDWIVYPDGNTLTEPILTPDAAGRHIKPGTKVVVELTQYPTNGQRAAGVITDVLGQPGAKDVDLKTVLVQFNLPEEFSEDVKQQARDAVDTFDPKTERHRRLDLGDQTVVTIDPPDAKDYDDAISLKQLDNGYWELGVHIADVSFFVKQDTPLDLEARERGNSSYFPGHVIPMLPEILSNGVCSLQEGVPRLTKSVFITYDDDARPISATFANSIITSSKRLRYIEAQDIIDGKAQIHHPDGNKHVKDYPQEVVALIMQMNDLAKRLQARRRAQGQLVLDLPEVELVLDEEGKVVDAVPEDVSFTHTLIEMFMVEANEAVARQLSSLNVPFLRRIHPEPEPQDAERLRHFTQVTGYHLPKDMDRKSIQGLLEHVRGKPEAFAINLAILKSLTRAEYSPETIGHFALASEDYCHFTSPIRRYADLTVHRLLDTYFDAAGISFSGGARAARPRGGRKSKPILDNVPSSNTLVELGRHISFTERRSEDAERELRQVKILTLLKDHVGDDFIGVVTGITNFGIFVQLKAYLVDGLIRYEDLMDDWWDVDERSGVVRGKRSGMRIGIGDVVQARVVRVDLPRRELDLAITQILKRAGGNRDAAAQPEQPADAKGKLSKHAKKKQKGRHKHGRNGRPQHLHGSGRKGRRR
jgi:ribonuclease R